MGFDTALARTKPALVGAGLDIPYSAMQVLLHDQTEATDGDRANQRKGWAARGGRDLPPRWRIGDGEDRPPRPNGAAGRAS